MTKALRRAGAAAAASALALIASMGSAHAAPTTTYAALGDSFSAGVGTSSPVNPCFQSTEGFPALIANATGWELNYLACSGATIPQIAGQVAGVAPDTDYITITAGGNDVGFSRVLLACATQPEEACAAAVAAAKTVIDGPLAGALAGLYAGVDAAAPDATVVVLGYPNLFKKDDCVDGQAISRAEMTMLNEAADDLNAVIRTQAEAAGFVFADPTPAFRGHASCTTVPYINGLTSGVQLPELFHPNDAGQVAYARVAARQLGVNGAVTRSTRGN